MKNILILLVIILLPAGLFSQYMDTTNTVYYPDLEQLKSHQIPQWFNDAKLGIFIHWGLYSVPAYAPTKGSIRDLLDQNPKLWFVYNAYAEWYLNTLRIKGSPTYDFHTEKYGADFSYYSFSKTFNSELKKWDPGAMAEIFKNAGAQYVVLTTKHHDGYTLWPSRVHNNNVSPECEPVTRNVVGELTEAVRNKGLRMGLYYSGGLDWTFTRTPILDIEHLWKHQTPQGLEYPMVADAHLRELIELYKPAVLWGDITYPEKGDIKGIVADYYNLVPDGVINNRWGIPGLLDFLTPEYNKMDSIHPGKWESCRGLGYSFGYNQFEDDSHTLSSEELIKLLVDVVSKNGNLLINVGPKSDGSIPEIQMERLEELGAWMKLNGEAIYRTDPWEIAEYKSASGTDLRFTKKEDCLYIHFFSRPGKKELLSKLAFSEGCIVKLLGSDKELKWKQKNDAVEISFPVELPGKYVHVLEVSELPEFISSE